MAKYIEAVKAAEIVSRRTKLGLVDLVDLFCELASEDVKPVVHAHWIKHRPYSQCSACGRYDYDGTDNYCGKCGAKMDEE